VAAPRGDRGRLAFPGIADAAAEATIFARAWLVRRLDHGSGRPRQPLESVPWSILSETVILWGSAAAFATLPRAR
jgi:hypothetical protein